MNICWKWTQAIQDEFVLFIGRGLETFCIKLVAQWILCTEWVPSEWIQTADKNITTIHMTRSTN